MNFPKLYKRSSTGKVVEWTISVTKNIIKVTYGEVGGKLQSINKTITGKNIGKSNETTDNEQAIIEARSEWQKQLDRKGYSQESDPTRPISPMLAQDYFKHSHKINWPCYAQPKLDGFRCLFINGNLISRQNKIITTLDHIKEKIKLPYDGELYSHELTFQEIASAIKKVGPNTKKIKYYVYDLIDKKPFFDRWSQIKNDVEKVETIIINSESELKKYHDECINKGFEGVMVRHGNAPYEHKRSYNLLKYKCFNDDEFLIISVREGKSTYKNMAIFTCQIGSKTFEVTAPGTHEDKSFFLRNPPVGKMLTVKYFGLTDDGLPRFPVAKSLR